MAQINISGVTFYYEGSYDAVFENASFSIDTDWKLGFIGRNGKGKTTFLNLLMGKYEYRGSIATSTCFDYFPYKIEPEWMGEATIDVVEHIAPDYELWKVCCELDLLHTDAELLYRPFQTLSHGERTKVMLAVLFSKDNYFLLIDEPTNHLDRETREEVKEYLNRKKGFILVSHDRWLLDSCVDHVLVLNRNTITVEKGNFSSWWENKQKQDAFELAENDKRKRENGRLEQTAKRTAAWADKVEKTKIGYDPIKETDRSISTRAYIGEKSRRMQQRRKNVERRLQAEIDEKSKLLKDLETPADLKLMPLNHHKEVYVHLKEFGLSYGDKEILNHVTMDIKRGERVLLRGRNGCGKSSIIKSILSAPGVTVLNKKKSDNKTELRENGREERHQHGTLEVASGLLVSYINQDTSHLTGSLDSYIEEMGVSNSLFKAVLRQLDFERVQFEKSMEEYSEGQKKKVLITGSLLQQAHLYIWDEPLNYIDVFSRMQIENLILNYQPTMLLVEHDHSFGEKAATTVIDL